MILETIVHKSPLFIDFEASSLSLVDSYPIQVGFICKNEDVQTYFINPESVQSWTGWSTDAEKAHQFPRDYVIQHGLHPHEVTAILNKKLMGRQVYCNGYGNDLFWCSRLFAAANEAPSFVIKDFFSLIPESFMVNPSDDLKPLYSLMVTLTRKAMKGRTHDAGNDVQYLVNLYARVKNAEDLLVQGITTFGKEKKFIRWLMSPVAALSGDSPVSRLATEEGKEQVKNILVQIQYGIYT